MTGFDRAARLDGLRALLDTRDLDAMLVSRAANKRYFSRFRAMDDEESSWPGTLFITRDATLILADSRYTEQAETEAPGWEVVLTTGAKFFARFRDLTATGFYTSPVGMKDIGYVGNTPLAQFEGPPPEVLRKLGLN